MLKVKEQFYYKCKNCSVEIFWNTHKKYTQCDCGDLAVDGCEDYVRIIGNAGAYEAINKAPSAYLLE